MKIQNPLRGHTLEVNEIQNEGQPSYNIRLVFNLENENDRNAFLNLSTSGALNTLIVDVRDDQHSILPTTTGRIKNYIEFSINDFMAKHLPQKPHTGDIEININLWPIIEDRLNELKDTSLFQVAVYFKSTEIHNFNLKIILGSLALLKKKQQKENDTHQILLRLSKPENKFLILYEDETNTLDFILESNNFARFEKLVDTNVNPFTLSTLPQVDLLDIDDPNVRTENIKQLFNWKKVEVKKIKNHYTLRLVTDSKNNIINETLIFRIKIFLNTGSSAETHFEAILPVILRRQRFKGNVALDFGTTNSACVYWDPSQYTQRITSRAITKKQSKNISTVIIKELLFPLEKSSNQTDLVEIIIFAARNSLKHRSIPPKLFQTIEEIKEMVVILDAKMANEQELITEIFSEFLLSFFNQGNLRIGPSNINLRNQLNQLYFKIIDGIIDIDIQDDFAINTVDLEPGSMGAISSAVKMDCLEENSQKYILPYEIDGYRSIIKMGQTIESEMILQDSEKSDDIKGTINTDIEIIHDTYVTGLKRYISDGLLANFIDAKGKVIVDRHDPVAFSAIRHIIETAEKKINGAVKDITVTYPANWPPHRRNTIRELLRACGIAKVDTGFDEATAGALYYIWRELLTDQFTAFDGFLSRSKVNENNKEATQIYFQNYLVFDMGGGTTDVALLEIQLEEQKLLPQRETGLEGRYFVLKPSIIGLTGDENYGGDNVTLAVFRILKTKLALNVLKSKAPINLDSHPSIKENFDRLLDWMNDPEPEEAYKSVKSLINEIVPTQFKSQPENRTSFFRLWKEAEYIKRDFSTEMEGATYRESRRADGEILQSVINLSNSTDVIVFREEMEKLIQPSVEKIFQKIQQLSVQPNKVSPEIHKVILTGSSSKLRIIKEQVKKNLGRPTVEHSNSTASIFKYDESKVVFSEKDAKLAVARGACLPAFLKTISTGEGDDAKHYLKRGKNFLAFDVDNLRTHLPFSVGYLVGIADLEKVFTVGDVLKRSQDESESIYLLRKRIPVGQIQVLHCHRPENENDSAFLMYLGSFFIQEAANQRQFDDENYFVFLEVNSNRDLACYMLPNKLNDYSTQQPDDPQKAKELLVQITETSSNWAPGPFTIICKNHSISHDLSINNEDKSPESLSLHKPNYLAIRDKYFIFVDDKLIWSFDNPKVDFANKDLAHVELTFNLDENGNPTIMYGIFDPEFDEDCKVSLKYVENMKRSKVFNPFSGDE